MGRDELITELAKVLERTAPGPDGTEIFMDEPWRAYIQCAEAILNRLDSLGMVVVRKSDSITYRTYRE